MVAFLRSNFVDVDRIRDLCSKLSPSKLVDEDRMRDLCSKISFCEGEVKSSNKISLISLCMSILFELSSCCNAAEKRLKYDQEFMRDFRLQMLSLMVDMNHYEMRK